jgi:thiamine pyrophosphate-dependent acetolactate synthase large subunit-like protein
MTVRNGSLGRQILARLADHRSIVCVFNNEDLNQVTWEQRIINGDPRFEASHQIPNVCNSRFADTIGLRGIYIDEPEMLSQRRMRLAGWMCSAAKARLLRSAAS